MGLIKARQPRADIGDDPAPAAPPSLDHPDPAVRRRAAHALEAAGNEALLCQYLAQEAEPSVRETILLGLVRLGTAEAAAGLAELLASDEAVLRNSALESLAAMPAEAARLLNQLRAAADPDVRIFAVMLAGELPHDWVPGWLVELLEEEAEANVCAAIAEILAEVGDRRAVPALERMRARFADEPFLGFVADTVIRRLPAA